MMGNVRLFLFTVDQIPNRTLSKIYIRLIMSELIEVLSPLTSLTDTLVLPVKPVYIGVSRSWSFLSIS